MPKNSRPDIQVLEARVSRLKAQLLEYTDIRTYEITKQRLSHVALELEECISIIREACEKGTSVPSEKIKLKEPEEVSTNEFDDDGDLSDVLFFEQDEVEPDYKEQKKGKYYPKFIVGSYANQLRKCADTPTGILQMNQISLLLNSWFKNRFTPDVRNPNFYYKAKRIHEWVDLLILSAGQALHEGNFPEFKVYMDEWISTLNTSKDENWILPLQVRQVMDSDRAYTKEAILIEKIIKEIIYNDEFYPDQKDAVARIVMKHEGFSEDDIRIQALLDACPKFITTSSFDINKYQ